MQLKTILLRGHTGDPALGIIGIGIGALLLRNHRHAAGIGHLQRKTQAGNAAAQYQIIVFLFHDSTHDEFNHEMNTNEHE